MAVNVKFDRVRNAQDEVAAAGTTTKGGGGNY